MTRTHAKLTHMEHEARAMLLGKVYDPVDGTYCLADDQGDPSALGMLCADTLEPLPPDHTIIQQRQDACRMERTFNPYTYDRQKETPYAAPDPLPDELP